MCEATHLPSEACTVSIVPAAVAEQDMAELMILLEDVCLRLAQKFGLFSSAGKPRLSLILDALLKYSCRGCIKRALQNARAKSKVDSLYLQNHELAVNLLVDGLRSSLEVAGLKLKVEQEVTGAYGRLDVIIKPYGSGLLLETADAELIVEVKTGSSFSYAQLIRYLAERPNAIGVIWRILPDQVLVIDPRRHWRLLQLWLSSAAKRGLDVLADQFEECAHAEFGDYVIRDPQRVVDEFFEALINGLPKVLATISGLLGVSISSETEKNKRP